MGTMTIYRGEYKVYECTASEDGEPLVLTGAAIYLAVRNKPPLTSEEDDSEAMIAKSTVDSGITITDGAAGEFEIEFTKADTNDLPLETFYYGIEAILSGYTDPVVLDVGTIEILSSYVRAV